MFNKIGIFCFICKKKLIKCYLFKSTQKTKEYPSTTLVKGTNQSEYQI